MVSSHVLRRIILLLPLASCLVFVSALLHLNDDHVLIVEGQREKLGALSKIIAAAIAADESTASPSIAPDRVAPILARWAVAGTRAQVFGHDGGLLVDTAPNLDSGTGDDRHAGIFDACMKFLGWLMWDAPPTRREVTEGGNAPLLPEVRMALSGSVAPLLVRNDSSEWILSMAMPIQYRQAIQGVLLLSTLPGEIDELLAGRARVILALCALSLVLSFAVGVVSYFLVGQVAGIGKSSVGPRE